MPIWSCVRFVRFVIGRILNTQCYSHGLTLCCKCSGLRSPFTMMSSWIRPSRVSTIFTLVKTSVWDDGSTFDCAQMHWLKQKKASKNTRIPNPSNEQKKQLGKLMTEPQPSQLISQPVFFPGPMPEMATFIQGGGSRHGRTRIRGNVHSWSPVPRSQTAHCCAVPGLVPHRCRRLQTARTT
jgi:hypothetical protein